jgi:hypothetical protein
MRGSLMLTSAIARSRPLRRDGDGRCRLDAHSLSRDDESVPSRAENVMHDTIGPAGMCLA